MVGVFPCQPGELAKSILLGWEQGGVYLVPVARAMSESKALMGWDNSKALGNKLQCAALASASVVLLLFHPVGCIDVDANSAASSLDVIQMLAIDVSVHVVDFGFALAPRDCAYQSSMHFIVG